MKILFLLTQDLESPTGIGRIWPIARALAARGHQVRVAALHSNWNSLTTAKSVREGVQIEYVAPMHVMKRENQKLYYSPLQFIFVVLRATWALFRAAISEKADIIHIGKPQPMNSIAGFIASKLKKSILCLDCDDYEAASNHFQSRWQQSIVAFFEMNLPRKARLVTTNTFFMRNKLLSWGCPADRIIYLANGIDEGRFLPRNPIEISNLRTRLNLEGKSVVLFIGTLSLTSHPVDLLLKAFKNVEMHQQNVALLIVGGGEDYQSLCDQANRLNIGHSTHIVGRLQPDEIPLYYGLADVSVDPVYDDDTARGRLPLKLFESWACAVPFVTSDVGDRSNFLSDPQAGILVRPAGDPNALSNGIIQVLEHLDLAQKLRNNGLEQVKKYTWDKLVAQLEQEYLKIL